MRFSLYPLSVLCATREHYIKHHKPIITVIPLIFAHFSPSNQHKHTLTISIATWKKYSSLFPFLWKYARSIHLWWYLLAFCWKHLDAVNWLRWYVGISHFLRRPRPYAPKFNSNAKWKCSQSNGFMTAQNYGTELKTKRKTAIPCAFEIDLIYSEATNSESHMDSHCLPISRCKTTQFEAIFFALKITLLIVVASRCGACVLCVCVTADTEQTMPK